MALQTFLKNKTLYSFRFSSDQALPLLRVEDAYAKKGSQCTQFEFKYEDENMVTVIHAFNMIRQC